MRTYLYKLINLHYLLSKLKKREFSIILCIHSTASLYWYINIVLQSLSLYPEEQLLRRRPFSHFIVTYSLLWVTGMLSLDFSGKSEAKASWPPDTIKKKYSWCYMDIFVYIKLYTVYANCTVYSIQYTVYANCTVYSIQYTLYAHKLLKQ